MRENVEFPRRLSYSPSPTIETLIRDRSHGFADLKNSINYNVVLSSTYAVGYPRRLLLGTPTQVWDTMLKCWSLEPTSDRFIEDIDAFPTVLEKIIAVKDEASRNGRRSLKSNNKRLINAKLPSLVDPCTHNASMSKCSKQYKIVVNSNFHYQICCIN